MHEVERLQANRLLALSVWLQDIAATVHGRLSPSVVAALLTLKHRGEVTATELAAILGLSQPATTRLLEGLEKNGWVVRRGRSGRNIPFGLTGGGRKLAARLEAERLAQASRALSGLLNHERRMLDRLLVKMLGAESRSRGQACRLCRFCDHGVCRDGACPVGSSVMEEDRHVDRA